MSEDVYPAAGRPAPPGGTPAPPGGPPSPPPPGRGRPSRRVRRRRALILGASALVVVLIVVLGGGYLYLTDRLGKIKRLDVSGLSAPTGPEVFLLTGSDSRAGEGAGAAAHFGSASQVAGQRSDVIILLRLDPAVGGASMLSIPRDTLVTIAGTDRKNRINDAFNSGPDQLVATIKSAFGITVNHYASVTFTGLQDLTDAVGGVCMSFPYPARDGSPTGNGNESGLNVPTAGPHVLNGAEALSLVRSRYYQYYKDGYWHPEGTGDLGRIVRQHEYMRALASKVVHTARGNPIAANRILDKAAGDVSVDSGLSNSAILRLGFDMRNLNPSEIPSWTLPTTAETLPGFGDVLVPDATQDAQVINEWNTWVPPSATTTTAAAPSSTVAPASVTVTVFNGSGVAGQAGAAAAQLRASGFQVGQVGNATGTHQTESVVTYAPGHQAEAQAVAARVGGPVTTRQASVPAGATVVLTTGTGFTGIIGVGAPGATTTTAPGPGAALPGQTPVPPWDPTPC